MVTEKCSLDGHVSAGLKGVRLSNGQLTTVFSFLYSNSNLEISIAGSDTFSFS